MSLDDRIQKPRPIIEITRALVDAMGREKAAIYLSALHTALTWGITYPEEAARVGGDITRFMGDTGNMIGVTAMLEELESIRQLPSIRNHNDEKWRNN